MGSSDTSDGSVEEEGLGLQEVLLSSNTLCRLTDRESAEG